MHNQIKWTHLHYLSAFVIGAILFWAFSEDWLNLSSTLVFIAGLIGVAVAVIFFTAWNIFYKSRHKEN